MEDVIFTSLVLAVGVVILIVVRRLSAPAEINLITAGWAAHVFAGFAQILVYRYYYEGGDLTTYFMFGVPGAEALSQDFGNIAPELVKAFFQQEFRLPFEMWAEGSTGTMMSISIGLLFLLGNSLWAVSVLIALCSFIAKVLIYRALRAEFPQRHHPALLAASVLIPSAVFWTSTLLKEPVMTVFFGPLFLGLRWILEGRRLGWAAVLTTIGGVGVALLKPYVLVSLVLTGALWVIWARVIRERGSILVKPVYLALAAGLLVVAFVGAGRFFPQLSPARVADSMTQQRRAAALTSGNSDFTLEGPEASVSDESGRDVASQLVLAPLALVTSLFRPFLLEARNATQFVNALETTWVLVLVVQIFRRNTIQQLVQRITASPTLMFCVAFTLVLGLGTGLSTSNLGALSRYRAPMMPFLFALLFMLRKPADSRANEPKPSAAPGRPAPLPRSALVRR